MRLTKYTHACVRVDTGAGSLLVDPGEWSEPAALAGVSAVLVTHEHVDHVDVDALVAAREDGLDLTVYTHAGLAARFDGRVDVEVVAPGDGLSVAEVDVSVVGGRHALIYGGVPDCVNLGFVLTVAGETVYHPGDSLFTPDVHIDTLLVPVSAPWLKLGEAVDFVRRVAPVRARPIHDALLSPVGVAITDRLLGAHAGDVYRPLPVGESLALGGAAST